MKGMPRGRIIALQPKAAPPAGWTRGSAAKPARLVPLMLALPLFAQVFHYMIDVGPIYYLSKAWPILMLPLAAYGAVGLRSRLALPYLAALVYVMGVTPVMSMIWLGNGFVDALANSVKVWPLTYYFSLLGLLVLLAPSPDEVVKAVLRLGIGTIVLMWLLWILVPASAYSGDPAESKLFLFEYERGNRIFFPMNFALLAMFYATQRLLAQPRPWQGLVIASGIATLVVIYQQRTTMGAALLVMAGMVILRLPRLWRSAALFAGLLSVIAVLWEAVNRFEQVAAKFGASLTIRQNSLNLLENYLGSQPMHWIFGSGAASRVGAVNMAEIIGRKDFYLADLGWAGIVFEFGAVGALLLMALYFLALRRAAALPALPDPRHRAMLAALTAYIAYLALSTAVYSAVFTPGDLASMIALMLYLAHVGRPGAAAPRQIGRVD